MIQSTSRELFISIDIIEKDNENDYGENDIKRRHRISNNKMIGLSPTNVIICPRLRTAYLLRSCCALLNILFREPNFIVNLTLMTFLILGTMRHSFPKSLNTH